MQSIKKIKEKEKKKKIFFRNICKRSQKISSSSLKVYMSHIGIQHRCRFHQVEGVNSFWGNIHFSHFVQSFHICFCKSKNFLFLEVGEGEWREWWGSGKICPYIQVVNKKGKFIIVQYISFIIHIWWECPRIENAGY